MSMLRDYRPLPEPRRRVYQPELPADVIHQLWVLKQATGRPMTQLLAEAVTTYLAAQPELIALAQLQEPAA